MQAKGRLLSMDVEEWKLQALKERAKRAGAGNIETRLITSSKTIKRLADSADALLLDVPCSGTGVFKRNPEGKWRHQPQHLEELIRLQADILRRYSKMLKVQGHLLYATCSILPAENQLQIQHFLAEQPHFSLLREEFINPTTTGWDGFYYALLSRNS
jgi:16S rRNA (cytosine967-C5)-methyltransferase